jgi:hypothetical protein
MTPLDGWENFYVIVGSSAGALIGLQFVVIALIADIPRVRGDVKASEAFGTPNVVHFAVALLLSALMVAPWDGIEAVAILWGCVGGIGIIYVLIVARRMRGQTAYEAVFEDWLFHLLLPLAAYTTLAVSACVAAAHPRPALFILAAAVLLLLFIGIHNAWDTVTWHIFVRKTKTSRTNPPGPADADAEQHES